MKVAICVVTFRRPKGLARLLGELGRLTFSSGTAPELEVVVVDNDPEGAAAAVCEEVPQAWPLRYEREPRRGISYARNAAVRYALEGGAEWIVFIDDDEAPEAAWLDELLRVQARYDADVVSGPAVRIFEGEVPAWVVKGEFFTDRRFATGDPIEHPATGNVLIRASVFEGMDAPFDERLALSGGEDTHFFLRLARAGRVMVWADDAVVREWIPESRARAGWILQRAYRVANTWSLCERELQPSARVVAVRIAKAMARVTFGLLLLPLSLPMGRHRLVRSLWYISFGAGNLAGLIGLRYQEYRVIHGR